MSFTSNSNYPPYKPSRSVLREDGIEYGFIGTLQGLKYEYRTDITDRASLEKNFRAKFEELNRVRLTDAEFARLLDEIVTPDVFTASKTLRAINSFTRDDGTPLNYSLVNLKDWCKNHFEVVRQGRTATIPFRLRDYLALVDWSGRSIRAGKRGFIAADAPPILKRLNIDAEAWEVLMTRRRALFGRAMGKVDAMRLHAASLGQSWIRGVRASERLYSN